MNVICRHASSQRVNEAPETQDKTTPQAKQFCVCGKARILWQVEVINCELKGGLYV